MRHFIFLHKTNPGLTHDVHAANTESARTKLNIPNAAHYKPANDAQYKFEKHIRTSGNPHGADEHATPEHLHV